MAVGSLPLQSGSEGPTFIFRTARRFRVFLTQTLSEPTDTIPPRKVVHEACVLRFSGFRCGAVSGTATTCGTNPAVRRISSRYSVFFNLREGPSEDPSD